MSRTLKIDEDGYFISDGLRVQDEEYGSTLLSHLKVDERGRYFTHFDGTSVAVEAFDDPLVVKMVSRSGNQFSALMPYHFQVPFDLEKLVLDEWDRFHGRTSSGVPFVFSRAAQAEFFNLLDDYDDDSFTVDKKKYHPEAWLQAFDASQNPQFWTNIYQNEEPGWELGHPSVALPSLLPQLKQPRSRVIVLGCGTGQDAAFFAQNGHIVTGIDFSEEAIQRAKAQFGGQKDLTFVHSDVFELPQKYFGQFDIVFEHTCYCAVQPNRRNDLMNIWRRLLVERGHLLGVFFTRDKPTGPPWGGSEWEIRQRLKKYFDFRYWTRWQQSVEKRQGYELVIWAQKKEV